MARLLAVANSTENVANEAGLIYMLGMIVLSISIMSMFIFACADRHPSSGKSRKRWGRGGGGGVGGGGGGCGGGGGGCGGGGGGGGG
ncbi:hypothetical protein ACP275_08G210000 [Erythranthe tilingii]